MSETISRLSVDDGGHPQNVERDIDNERELGVRAAVALLRDGRAGMASYVLRRSVERQWAKAGLAYSLHPKPCPCGTRCQDGATS